MRKNLIKKISEKTGFTMKDSKEFLDAFELCVVEAMKTEDELKEAEYMEDHIGEEYKGVISGVTESPIPLNIEPKTLYATIKGIPAKQIKR